MLERENPEQSGVAISGGVLCEPMGTGKTLISLLLIMHSRFYRPRLPRTLELQSVDDLNPKRRRRAKVASLQRQCLRALVLMEERWEAGVRLGQVLPKGVQELLGAGPLAYYMYPPWDVEQTWQRNGLNLRKRPRLAQIQVYLSRATVIVVPQLLFNQWLHEIENFFEPGALHVEKLDDDNETAWMRPSAEQFDGLARRLCSADVVLTTPSCVRRGAEVLEKFHFLRLMVDEGHLVGKRSLQTDKLKELKATHRWAVSGTPTPQGVGAIEGIGYILDFVGVPRHSNLAHCSQCCCLRDQCTCSTVRRWPDWLASAEALCALLNRLLFRHSMAAIGSQVLLPQLDSTMHRVTMTDVQRLVYNQFVALVRCNLITAEYEGPDCMLYQSHSAAKTARQALENIGMSCSWREAVELVARASGAMNAREFRERVARHRAKASDDDVQELCEIEALLLSFDERSNNASSSAKIVLFLQRISEILAAPQHKIIVFSRYPITQQTLSELITSRGHGCLTLNYGQDACARKAVSTLFNDGDAYRILIVDIRLASEGLNLPAASHVHFVEPVYSATRFWQAVARAYRLGNKHQRVYVETFVMSNSIEDEQPDPAAQQPARVPPKLMRSLRATINPKSHAAQLASLSYLLADGEQRVSTAGHCRDQLLRLSTLLPVHAGRLEINAASVPRACCSLPCTVRARRTKKPRQAAAGTAYLCSQPRCAFVLCIDCAAHVNHGATEICLQELYNCFEIAPPSSASPCLDDNSNDLIVVD